jgi:hypothetical protein
VFCWKERSASKKSSLIVVLSEEKRGEWIMET